MNKLLLKGKKIGSAVFPLPLTLRRRKLGLREVFQRVRRAGTQSLQAGALSCAKGSMEAVTSLSCGSGALEGHGH